MNFMFNILEMYEKYKIPLKGVIHVGAFEAGELPIYKQLKIPKIVYIEANPEIYKDLIPKLKKNTSIDIYLFCCAISNKNGRCKFHITSEKQSSSILPLKVHKEIYPSITETECIEVPCYTLDKLLEDKKLNPSDFNFINIDIQGAELLAFQGATNLLTNHIVAINTEINIEELYEGCVLEPDLTKFLQGFGFSKKEEIKPFHPTWGDAFYLKEGNG